MGRNLFMLIDNDLKDNFEIFELRCDAKGRRGFTMLQKCTKTLWNLGCDMTSDAMDEYVIELYG